MVRPSVLEPPELFPAGSNPWGLLLALLHAHPTAIASQLREPMSLCSNTGVGPQEGMGHVQLPLHCHLGSRHPCAK